MRTLDRAVLVAFAGIAARRRHLVVVTKGGVGRGDIHLRRRIQIAVRRRQAVGAQLARHATQLRQRRAQTLGQRREALAPQHHRRARPARTRQPRMQKTVRQRLAADQHPDRVHHREIRNQLLARRMLLREAQHLLRACQRPPLAHPALQRPRQAVPVDAGMALLQPRQHRHRLQAGLTLQQRLDLRPRRRQGIATRSV